MTRPKGRIEVWEPGGGSALYTINDAVGIYYKDIITDGIGNFNFTVYSHKDFSGTYTYPSIDLGDTVKIWLDWDTIAGDPNFIGKVTKRSGPILTDTGWVRRIAGLSQGKVLLNRLKKNKYYDAIDASVIVREWATDLGLQSDPWKVETETTDVTLEVKTKSYFDLLRWISDYYDVGGSLKKDFYVDTANDLVWADRPLRTVGVETIATSDFLSDPLVERQSESVKNDIVVYGAANTFIPTDKDDWTENNSSNWTATQGTLQHDYSNGWAKVGTYCIKSTAPVSEICQFHRTHDKITIRTVNSINFWHFDEAQVSDDNYVRLRAPDAGNYFQAEVEIGTNWMLETIMLGPSNETTDPTEHGKWYRSGSPNWYNILATEFYYNTKGEGHTRRTDGLYYAPERVTGSADDAGSKTTYGTCEAEFTDDKLLTVADCVTRAETLLYQLKDAPIQITATIKGNDNVLAGDRLTITIPSESISAQSYDVIAVENLLNLDNWITRPIMVNSVNWRVPLNLRQQVETRRRIRELGMNELGIR